ncbi:MAG: beta-ketoacyl synthase N-terminal-like domain-containing protein, partial [Acidobacteriota bacterium]
MHNNLIDAFNHHKDRRPDGRPRGVRFIRGWDDERVLPYAELFDRARRALAQLRRRGVAAGDRVLLVMRDNERFVEQFWACVMGDIVPAPLLFPAYDSHAMRIVEVARRLQEPASDGPWLLSDGDLDAPLTKLAAASADDAAVIERLRGRQLDDAALRLPELADADPATIDLNAPDCELAAPSWDDLCYLQFSSGSTGDPKGVRVTHGNLLANVDGIRRSAGLGDDEMQLSWMPLTHDFGLIWFHILPVVLGLDQGLIPTRVFARHPLIWMGKISEHGAAITAGPNSAYQRVVRAYRPERCADWDLSGLRMAINGAEPISPTIYRDFLACMQPHGLAPGALCPGYGLAEGTLVVSFSRSGAGLVTRAVDRTKIPFGGSIDDALDGPAENAIEFADVGPPIANVDVRITDDDGRALPTRTIGHIEIAGPSIMHGYENAPEATAAVLKNGWLDTGDLGFLDDGHIFITGRVKELIIINGLNHYPHDVELVATEVDGVDFNKVIACGVRRPDQPREELALFVEHRGALARFVPIVRRLRDVLIARMGLIADLVVPIARVPKTTSGKLQRGKLAAQLLDGDYDDALAAIDAQLARDEAAARRDAAALDRRAALRTHLEAAAHAVVERDRLDPAKPLMEQGFTSLRLVDLLRRLNARLGAAHPISLVFDHPTLDALIEALAAMPDALATSDDSAGSDAPATADAAASADDAAPGDGDDAIAIIGMALRFPAGADDPAAFWQLLTSGRDAVGEIPPGRWPAGSWHAPAGADGAAPGTMSTRHGAFLAGDVDGFDHGFFGLTPHEAARIDPQQRLLLEISWEALADAGLDAEGLRGSRTGVFVGLTNTDYAQAEARSGALDAIGPYAFTGSAPSVAAGRLSYVHGWRGPSLTVDTACSSSLLALHLAAGSLRGGESDLALAGGVNLMLAPEPFVGLSQMGALASDGRCKAFDDAADGYGRGEGCGLVVLKRLADARRDGDRVLAIVDGSAVNHDGASNGLTVPSAAAQRDVVAAALDAAGVAPDAIDVIEAHGTGTPLGDPLEVEALNRVFGPRAEALPIASVKSHIGHLESAAGIAGVIKTVLALQAEQLPAPLHLHRPNRHVDWAASAVAPLDRDRPWPRRAGRVRRAGVSSFGLSGTNVHVVLAGPERARAADAKVDAPAAAAQPGPLVLPLSARSDAALAAVAAQAAAQLAAEPADAAAICAAYAR